MAHIYCCTKKGRTLIFCRFFSRGQRAYRIFRGGHRLELKHDRSLLKRRNLPGNHHRLRCSRRRGCRLLELERAAVRRSSLARA